MFNPMQNNPQQMLYLMIQNNPQMQQLLQGVNINDPKSMEQVCRNVCMQKGIDFDTMLTQFIHQNSK